MNLTQSNYHDVSSNRNLKRTIGLALVIALHIAMLNGLMRNKEIQHKIVDVQKKVLKAVVIQEVIIPPSITKPPKETPKMDTPPPKHVEKPKPLKTPPKVTEQPQIAIPELVSDNIIDEPINEPVDDEPSMVEAQPAVQNTPTPVKSVTSASKPISIGVACPTQVAPKMPRKAISNGIEGIVKAHIHIVNGIVKEVIILSGPKIFHKPVISAVMEFKCNANVIDVIATKDFAFKLE